MGDASKGRSSEPCSGSYWARAVGFLSETHKGVGLRQSAKQLLMWSPSRPRVPLVDERGDLLLPRPASRRQIQSSVWEARWSVR